MTMSSSDNAARRGARPRQALSRSAAASSARRSSCTPCDGVDLDVRRGETLGVVGESGCGKSTLGRSLLRLIEPTAGTVRFDGTDLGSLSGAELRRKRREMQIIFQDPYSSLNPRMRVGAIVGEGLTIHGLATRRRATPPRRGAARAGRAARRRVRSLSARVQRRPAPAHRHRARSRRRAALHRRRRAGVGARRLDPGADRQSAAGPAGADGSHVSSSSRTTSGSSSTSATASRSCTSARSSSWRRAPRSTRPAPSLHARAAVRGAHAEPARREPPHRIGGRRAEPDRAADGLRVPSTLLARGRHLSYARAEARDRCARPRGRLPRVSTRARAAFRSGGLDHGDLSEALS